KEEDLKSRELQVAEDRNAIDDLARRTEALRTDLDTRIGQVQAGESELVEKTNGINERETAVRTIESQLNEREQGIGKEEERRAWRPPRPSSRPAKAKSMRPRKWLGKRGHVPRPHSRRSRTGPGTSRPGRPR